MGLGSTIVRGLEVNVWVKGVPLKQKLNTDSFSVFWFFFFLFMPQGSVLKTCFNHSVGLRKTACQKNTYIHLAKEYKSILSATWANHISAMNRTPLLLFWTQWSLKCDGTETFIVADHSPSWHTSVLKQYPYCWDISIKAKKKERKKGILQLWPSGSSKWH